MLLPSAVEALRGAGFEVDAADVAHVGPTVIEHISVHGRYYYDLDRLPKGKGLRPARRVAWSPSPDRPRPTGPDRKLTLHGGQQPAACRSMATRGVRDLRVLR